MRRREKERRTGKGPSIGISIGTGIGMPKGIVLLATPDGWRYRVLAEGGGAFCGCLPDAPADAGPREARAAAAAMVRELARQVRRTDVDVVLDPPREPGSRTGRVVPAPADDATAAGTRHHGRNGELR
ncbi:hypothetical protein ACSNOK_24205 [Streptomyces sp. URMC 126]|uniref:hypothetical protein n=1 Tax=Streptomyces sp. URMC 126 TaxID=3423401 RepID=UPI003F1A3DAD